MWRGPAERTLSMKGRTRARRQRDRAVRQGDMQSSGSASVAAQRITPCLLERAASRQPSPAGSRSMRRPSAPAARPYEQETGRSHSFHRRRGNPGESQALIGVC